MVVMMTVLMMALWVIDYLIANTKMAADVSSIVLPMVTVIKQLSSEIKHVPIPQPKPKKKEQVDRTALA